MGQYKKKLIFYFRFKRNFLKKKKTFAEKYGHNLFCIKIERKKEEWNKK